MGCLEWLEQPSEDPKCLDRNRSIISLTLTNLHNSFVIMINNFSHYADDEDVEILK